MIAGQENESVAPNKILSNNIANEQNTDDGEVFVCWYRGKNNIIKFNNITTVAQNY